MWVKICGIQDVATAAEVVRHAPDAIGLNFYRPSPRHVTDEVAADIVGSLPRGVEPVGLFVNHPVWEIAATCSRCGLRTVQLHGDEPPDQLAALLELDPDLTLIRAWRLGPQGFAPLADDLAACERLGVRLFACLIDARVDGLYGGSGRTVPWNLVREEYHCESWPPLILAGGLTPGNVAEAVRTVRPWGVDTASGVETAPGKKDPRLVADFVARSRAAFATTEGI